MMNDPYLKTWDAAFKQRDRAIWKTSVFWLAIIGFVYQLESITILAVRVALSFGQGAAMPVIIFLSLLEMAVVTRTWLFWDELQVSRSLSGSIPDARLEERVLWLAKRNASGYVFAMMGIGLAAYFGFMVLIRL
ncbi:MAG: hypothetical protein ACYC92_06255 [Candidatus Acidiferrales bacterium]